MQNISLSLGELSALQKRKKVERSVRILRRLQCIQLKHDGMPHRKIAHLLDVTPDTVTDWCRLFLREGYKGLCVLRYAGRRRSKLDPYSRFIGQAVHRRRVSDLQELQSYIRVTWGITVERSWLWRYCQKNDIIFHTEL